MNAEKRLSEWIEHAKNKDPYKFIGLLNGEIPGTLRHIAPGELILALESNLHPLPVGRGYFIIQMKQIARWVQIWGEFVPASGIPVYRKSWYGRQQLIFRLAIEAPRKAVTLQADKIMFCHYQPFIGYVSKSYTLKKNVWTKI